MKGIIYKILNEEQNIIYIGSTSQTLKRRWNKHKSDYKRWIEGKAGCHSMIFHEFKKHGIDQFNIELIEEIEFEDKCELLKLENSYISTIDCVNKQASYTGLNKKEYNKQYWKEYKKA